MGSTNKTTNYELSQYIGTDKPSWLNDYNNDMLKIDTQMKANATAAGNAQTTANTADGKADGNAIAIQTLNTQINTPDTGLAATVAANTLDITNIGSTIGTTPLTTVAQTLTGAIEEVKGSIPSTTNVLKYTGTHTISVTADNVKTRAELLNDVFAAFLTYIATKGNDYRFTPVLIGVPGITCDCTSFRLYEKSYTGSHNASTYASPTMYQIHAAASGSYVNSFNYSTGTYADESSTVPASGSCLIVLNEYQVM